MIFRISSCSLHSANHKLMKLYSFSNGLGVSFFLILASNVLAAPVAMQEAVTHEQLVLVRSKSDHLDPMKLLAETQGADPSVVNRPKSLLDQSDIISFGNFATLVPKRAILQIPKNLAGRIQIKPGVTIQSWSDFFAANRGWITTVEVSRTQAEGNAPIAEETATRISKSSNLIVATYLGGPISVLPIKVAVDKNSKISKP